MSLTDVAIFDLITCIDQRKFDKQSPECPGSLPYFQGNGRLGPLGVHLWVSQRDVSGAEGSLVSRFINEKPYEVTWLLVSSSRIPLNSDSDERLANRLRILQRLWDHPREACSIEAFLS